MKTITMLSLVSSCQLIKFLKFVHHPLHVLSVSASPIICTVSECIKIIMFVALQQLLMLQWQLVNTKFPGMTVSLLVIRNTCYQVTFPCTWDWIMFVIKYFLLRGFLVNELPHKFGKHLNRTNDHQLFGRETHCFHLETI